MTSYQISAIRVKNGIDVYIKDGFNLVHYWANDSTKWAYKFQILYENISSKCAITRNNNYIDLYFISSTNQLIHGWVGDQIGCKYKFEVLLNNVSAVSPTAVRFNNFIDLYCVDLNQRLVHLYISDSTNQQQKYFQEVIYESKYKITSLYALRVMEQLVDLYFCQNSRIVHMRAGKHNNWKYSAQEYLQNKAVSNGQIVATRFNHDIDIFFIDLDGYICKYFVEERTECKLTEGFRLKNGAFQSKDYKLSVIRYNNHIDLYYIGKDNHVYHTYCGQNNKWTWNQPQKISRHQALTGVAAVRPFEKAIDVFYVGNNHYLNRLFIGQGTGNKWEKYDDGLLDKTISEFSKIQDLCQKIGSGYHGDAYLYKQKNIVVKIMRQPNLFMIRNQVRILDKLNSIWPDLVQYQVTEYGQLVGFSMKYFPGKKIENIYLKQGNIYFHSRGARIRLYKKLKHLVNKIQQLGICHGDLTLDNILVLQEDQKKQQCQIRIIDFGNALQFNGNSLTSSGLTGWTFTKPPQSRINQRYNPIGVNAYMLGRLALQILLKTPFNHYHLKKIPQNPAYQLDKLVQKGYDNSVIQQIKRLTHNDIYIRSKQLNKKSIMQQSDIKNGLKKQYKE